MGRPRKIWRRDGSDYLYTKIDGKQTRLREDRGASQRKLEQILRGQQAALRLVGHDLRPAGRPIPTTPKRRTSRKPTTFIFISSSGSRTTSASGWSPPSAKTTLTNGSARRPRAEGRSMRGAERARTR